MKQLNECLNLLMAWIYDHFPMISNATPNSSYDDSQPRVCKRKNNQFGGDWAFALLCLREQLDTLTEHDVVWNSYSGIRETSLGRVFILYWNFSRF